MKIKKLISILCIILITITVNIPLGYAEQTEIVDVSKQEEVIDNSELNENESEKNEIDETDKNLNPNSEIINEETENNINVEEETENFNDNKEKIKITNEIKDEEIKSTTNNRKTIEEGTYQIVSALDNNKVIKIDGAYNYKGANAQLSQNYNNINQRFEIIYIGEGYYKIEAKHSGKVLDVSNAGTTNGTNVQQWEDNNTDAQKWIIKEAGDGYYYIISKCNELFVDAEWGKAEDGTNIQMYEGNGTDAQKFKFKKIVKNNPEETIEEGTYQIVSALDNNKVIKIDGAYNYKGANAQLSQNYNNINQRFEITYIGEGYYKIEAKHSGKVLDVSNAGTTNGTNVQQWEDNNTDAQKWIIKEAGDGYYYIISKCNELYVDAEWGKAEDGTNIQMYEGNGTDAQKFKFKKIVKNNPEKTIEEGTYQIVSALDNNKVLDVDHGYKDSGVNVSLYKNKNSNNQKFEVTYIGGGYYKIQAVHSRKALDVSGAEICNWTNVQQWEDNNTDAQKWIIKEAGDGYYYIISKCNELYVDIEWGKAEDGTNIQMYEGNETDAQKFKFIETEKTKEIYNGIDVSVYNGEINWKRVSQTQDFAIIRVGYRGYLRPRIVMDSKFIQNIQGAQSQNISCGVYFFTQAINEEEAIEEANWVADMIAGYRITYPVILDSEWSNEEHNGRADVISKEDRTRAAKAFLDTIKKRGYIPMLYGSPYWLKTQLNMSELSSYDLWLAHYTDSVDKPSNYSGTYTMWQYTSKGRIEGILTDVDRNVCYKQY